MIAAAVSSFSETEDGRYLVLRWNAHDPESTNLRLLDLETTSTTAAELRNQLEAARVEKDRQMRDAEVRIEKLNERIRELNQQLAGGAKAAPEKPQTGFFKR